MRIVLTLVILSIFLCSCGAKKSAILSTSTNRTETSNDYEPFFDIVDYAPNKNYGLVGDKPIMVGEKSVSNQRRFISSLAGPNGELLIFHRRGSCCPYKSEKGFGGTAFVDVYEVMYDGLTEPILLYISFYDLEMLYIPKGFTKRK